METIKKTSLRNLYQNGYFKTLSTLRINSSNYPYITLLDKDNKANNVYFGKNTSKLLLDNFTKGDSITSFLSDADVLEVLNDKNECRFKITKNGSKYASESSLQEAFGETPNAEFDYEGFKNEFTSVIKVEETVA